MWKRDTRERERERERESRWKKEARVRKIEMYDMTDTCMRSYIGDREKRESGLQPNRREEIEKGL